MITPIEQAMDAYQRMNPSGDFAELEANYLRRGFVYSGDDAFILAMPSADAWFVHLAAVDMRRFLEVAPYRRTWVAWQRRGTGPVRRYRWDRYARLINRQHRHEYGIDRLHPRTPQHGRGRPRLVAGAD